MSWTTRWATISPITQTGTDSTTLPPSQLHGLCRFSNCLPAVCLQTDHVGSYGVDHSPSVFFLSSSLPSSRERGMWTRGEGATPRNTRNESTVTEAEVRRTSLARRTLNSFCSRDRCRAGLWLYLIVVITLSLWTRSDVVKSCSVQPFTGLFGSQTPTLAILSLSSLLSPSTPLHTMVYSSRPSLVTIPAFAYLSALLLEMGN